MSDAHETTNLERADDGASARLSSSAAVDVQLGARGTLKIYINGSLHLAITEEVYAVQSWLNSEGTLFSIEYSTLKGDVLTEYASRDLWLRILKRLDQSLKPPTEAVTGEGVSGYAG